MELLRKRLNESIENNWMGGAAIIFNSNGEIDAVPGAYKSDVSFTQPVEWLSVCDIYDIEYLLSLTDKELNIEIQQLKQKNEFV